jgi:hypothetical protein
MKTLSHWFAGLPLFAGLAVGTLAYYFAAAAAKLARRKAQPAEDCHAPLEFFALKPGPYREYAQLPDGQAEESDARDFPGAWCPVHECEYWEMDCPECNDELWDQRWTTTDQAEYDARNQADLDSADDHINARTQAGDGWYRDLCERAENGWNGSDPRRPEGGF